MALFLGDYRLPSLMAVSSRPEVTNGKSCLASRLVPAVCCFDDWKQDRPQDFG